MTKKGACPLARPRRFRRVCREPEYNGFFPEGIAGTEEVVLSVDEKRHRISLSMKQVKK